MKCVLVFVVLCAMGIDARRAELNYSGRQRLVGYWGQDSAGALINQGPLPYEDSLAATCQSTKFDIITISYLDYLWDTRNKNSLPGLDLASHCTTNISPDYESLLRCPQIEEDIKACQNLGKKVLLSIGGTTGDGTLPSPNKAAELAQTLYNLFLGGSLSDGDLNLRPFGSAILDGINIDVQGGQTQNYDYLIRGLRMLMNDDQNKEYLLAASPGCNYPDQFLGPEGQTGLELEGEEVDHLYVKFFNDPCHTGDQNKFLASLQKWLDFSTSRSPRGPLVFIGIPAAPGAASASNHYRTPQELQHVYSRINDRPFVGGIMLWDLSWDKSNEISGKRYSEHAFTLLNRETVLPETTTDAPNSSGVYTCEGKSDGNYADPNDCSKYYTCSQGAVTSYSCPQGLLFNKTMKSCDFAQNVTC